MHDNTLTKDNRDKFNQIAKNYNQQIKFYNLETLIPDKLKLLKEKVPGFSKHRLGIGTCYRLIISDVIPKNIDKIIYLDSGDTLIHRDIKDFWSMNVSNFPLAAIPEIVIGTDTNIIMMCNENIISAQNYFNAGILILNLNYFRNTPSAFDQGYKFLRENPHFNCLDQDILNYCFSTNYLKLSKDFNTYVCWNRRDKFYKIERVIYHYNSSPLGIGINLDISDIYSRLYLEYFSKTPWFNVDMLGNLFKKICQIYSERANLSVQITKILAGKERAFFTDFNSLAVLSNVFSISPNELIINAAIPPNPSVELLVKNMRQFNSKKLFFIFVGYYEHLRNFLTQQGFLEGRDFINGNIFFANNPQNDSYSIVRSM